MSDFTFFDKNEIPEAYILDLEEYIDCLSTKAFILKHKKSGARVCLLSNSDDNKMFCAAFKTPPEDDSGTPHIIEHSVLNGSEKYPVKDPFMQLVKGSMYTFLNAMTYPDKTVYPVSSCNNVDFVNLSNVYLDAVFAPNIRNCNAIFMQEGWHYEPCNDGSLEVGGVVYSEMKGAVSSADSNIYDEIIYAMFPDNAYGKNSGGDPDSILTLTYEKFLDYYNRHYSASNAYIVIYGNADFAERLSYMDENYLSKFEKSDETFEILPQNRFGSSVEKRVTKSYPIGEGESGEGKSYLGFGSVVVDCLDVVDCFALDFLSDILVESPGAPLKKALIDAGIGSEIYGGLVNHMKEPIFTIISKNTDPDKADEFIKIITDTLSKIAAEGVSRKSLLAAIERSEFKFLEGEQGSSSRGLALALSMLQSWLFTDTEPFRYLKIDKVYATLREMCETDYYEKLVSKLITGDHRVLLSLIPEAGLNEKNSKKLAKQLAEYKASLSDVEFENICRNYEALCRYQDREESDEILSCIPMLSKEDIPDKPHPIFNRELKVADLPAVIHDIPVNGLCYMRFMFDVSHICAEDLPLLDVVIDTYGKVDTEFTEYAELIDEIRLNTGGFSIACTSYRKHGTKEDFKLMLELSIRCFARKTSRALEIASEVINKTHFTDKKRIRENLAEIVSEKERDIMYSGSEYASARAMAYINSADATEELIDGISSYMAQKELLSEFDARSDEILASFERISKTLFNKNTCILSLTVDADSFSEVQSAIEKFVSELPSFEKQESAGRKALGKLNEAFSTPSQVNYVACAGNLIDGGYKYNGAYQILASMIRNDYLYPEIRMRGGAYGYSCQISKANGNFTFSTYRDPALGESLDTFKSCGDFVRKHIPSDDELNRYIIGTFGKLDRPLTPYANSVRSLSAYLSGVSYESMCKDRLDMLNVKADELQHYADSIDFIMSQNAVCVIGNEQNVKRDADRFDSVIKLL